MLYTVTNRWEFAENWASLDDLFKYFNNHKEVGFDIETSGLSFIDSKIYTMQVGDSTHQYVVDIESLTNEELKSFIVFLISKELVIHNAAFELPFLYNLGVQEVVIFDTYLAENILTMGILASQRSLSACLKKYLNIELDKEQRGSIIESGITSNDDIEYSANDVKYILQLKELQLKEINKQNLDQAMKLENSFIKVLAYIEYCGIYLDKDEWHKHIRFTEYKEYEAFLKLIELSKEYGVTEDINWDSPKQVMEAFQLIGIDTYNKKEDKNSVDAKFLEKQNHPLIKVYLDYKEKNKVVTTYGRNFYNYIMSDGRIHTKYKSLVDTSRTACGNVRMGPFPNMQNLSSESNTRACFAGQKGNVLIVGDYSSQESVLMADTSREPALLEFFKSGGGDMHSYVAQQIYKDKLGKLTLKEIKDQYPELRTAAKAAGFAIQYGGNGYTIANNMNIDSKLGEEIFENYMKAFPKLKNYFDKVFKETINNGYILLNKVTNRKRFVPDLDRLKLLEGNDEFWEKFKEEKTKDSNWYKAAVAKLRPLWGLKSTVYRLSLNTPIQGTAADMSKVAGVLILRWIIKNKSFGKVKIVNFVHDEYVIECHPKKAETISAMMKSCMEEAANVFTKILKIKVDPVITKVWKK